jgi:hypothetical protein
MPRRLTFNLICSANREVLRRLAERLPASALGFTGTGSDRAQTALEFGSAAKTGFSTFNGKLTDHLLPADAFALIEQLLESPASAIRSTAFSLSIERLRWNGSPPDSHGSLHLSDLKAFNRAARFSLTATLQVSGDDPKSKGVRVVLDQVTEATGLRFEKARISHILAEEARTPARAQSLLVGQICFDEAMEDIANQLHKHWFAEFAPGVLGPNEVFEQRFGQWASGQSAKVNLPALLKRVTRDSLPGLRFDSAEGDEIFFSQPLGTDSELIVLFQKALPRLGKAFKLYLGVRSKSHGARFLCDATRLSRSTAESVWTYADNTEAELVVREAVRLARELVPRFESALQPLFAPAISEIPPRIEQLGKMTAREAFARAKPTALRRFSDAELVRLRHTPRSLAVRDIEGPELTFDGRLTRNAAWTFHFYSADAEVSFEVTVPCVGRITMLDHGNQVHGPAYIQNPIGEDWIDSDQALALAEQRGGRQRRASGQTFGIGTKLERVRSPDPYWGIMYLVVDTRGRNDLILHMDAATGEEITSIQGF